MKKLSAILFATVLAAMLVGVGLGQKPTPSLHITIDTLRDGKFGIGNKTACFYGQVTNGQNKGTFHLEIDGFDRECERGK